MALDWGAYLGDAREKGADVCVSSWNRPAPNTLPSWAKAGGNYLSSQLIAAEARRGGYDEGIALGHNGLLSEGAGENLFLVKKGKLLTPPTSAGILAGITRDSVITLAADLGLTRGRARPAARSAVQRRRSVHDRHRRRDHPGALGRSQERSAAASPARSPARCSRPSSACSTAAPTDRWGWLEYVDAASPAHAAAACRCRRSSTDRTHRWRSRRDRCENPVRKNLGRACGGAGKRRHAGDPVCRPAPGARSDLAAGVQRTARARAQACVAPTACWPRWTTPRRPCRPAPTASRPYANAEAQAQVHQLEANCREFGIELHGWDSADRGIVHVIGPELGATQPGMTIVCGDSHTSTHGAFGALAFGIGTTEVGHVMATQCLLQRKPKTLAIHVDGALPEGVGAKDLILHIIGQIGVDGGTGHVIEYRGAAIEALSMEERMTVCNMSIEAGARAGLIAPDETTFAWLQGSPACTAGRGMGRRRRALERSCARDDGARYDREVRIDAAAVKPTVTYGTHPGMAIAMDAPVPAATQCTGTARAGLHAERSRASRCRARRWTWCSSAAAPTRACPTCARPPRVLRGRHVAERRAHAGGARLRGGAPRRRARRPASRCSPPPAPSGACPAARCASP